MSQETLDALPPLPEEAERLIQRIADRTAAEVAGSKVAEIIVVATVENLRSDLRVAQQLSAYVSAKNSS